MPALVLPAAAAAALLLTRAYFKGRDRVGLFLHAIDEINAQDPRTPPQELEYGRRMSACLSGFWRAAEVGAPPAVLVMACRAQHVARWRTPRSEYPLGKVGYLAWKKGLLKLHAEVAQSVMDRLGGFSAEERARVGKLLMKQDMKNDPLVQALEDVACLVFLTYYLRGFLDTQPEDKVVDILVKSWKKMSAQARDVALRSSGEMGARELSVVQQALERIQALPPPKEQEEGED